MLNQAVNAGSELHLHAATRAAGELAALLVIASIWSEASGVVAGDDHPALGENLFLTALPEAWFLTRETRAKTIDAKRSLIGDSESWRGALAQAAVNARAVYCLARVGEMYPKSPGWRRLSEILDDTEMKSWIETQTPGAQLGAMAPELTTFFDQWYRHLYNGSGLRPQPLSSGMRVDAVVGCLLAATFNE